MATRYATTLGLWSTAGIWDAPPADGDSVILNAGVTVTMDADLSAWTGLVGVTICGSDSTPACLRFVSGTDGVLKLRTGGYLQGSSSGANKGRLLANNSGVWGETAPLSAANLAVFDLNGTANIKGQYLDIGLYCTQPSATIASRLAAGRTLAQADAETLEYARLTADASAGATVLSVDRNVTSWSGLLSVIPVVSVSVYQSANSSRNITVASITSTQITLSAGLAYASKVGDVIALANRNIEIRSGYQTDINLVDMTSNNAGGSVLQCSIRQTGTLQKCNGVVGGTSHTISGTISGCTYGVSYGTSHTVSGTISGCTYGVNGGTSYTVSGTISGCTYGVNGGTSHTISGTISGCTYGVSYGTSHTVSGTISGCTYGVNGGTSHTVSGTISGCTYGVSNGISYTVSGTISGCTYGVNGGTSYTVSGTISGCTYGVSYGTSHTVSGTISGCSYGVGGGTYNIVGGIVTASTTADIVTSGGPIIGRGAQLASTTICSTANRQKAYPSIVAMYDYDAINKIVAPGYLFSATGGGLIRTKAYSGALVSAPPVTTAIVHEALQEIVPPTGTTAANSEYREWVEWTLQARSGVTINLTFYVKPSAASMPKMPTLAICDPNQGYGADVLVSATAAASTAWQTLSLTYTPTRDGSVTVRFEVEQTAANDLTYFFWTQTFAAGGLFRGPFG